ncbi:MAG: cytochrome bc complex cytochrome b subunit [Phycisphaerae bacterium]|nr:cytochrome bc complex cytochrome b subunit [Phycisphaerae bacterium]
MDGAEKSAARDSHKPTGLSRLLGERPRWSHYLGSTAMFLLVLQIMTGFLLLLYYQPNSRDAHDSVRVIMMDIPMGWIIRSLHHRCSHLLILTVIVHALDVLLAKTFRRKRSPTYYTGVLLLFCVLFMGFTGYLLPWDTLSVVATAVGTGLPNEIPLVGPLITEFFRGGSAIGAQTLPRFFALHISVIPMTVGLALGFHIFFIRSHGMRRPIGPQGKPVPLYPDYILRQGVVCLWVFAILLTAAILLPAELRPEGDPMAPAPEGIRPEWYFLAAFEAIKLGGNLTFLTPIGVTAELLSLILLGGAIGVFVLMPVLDRKGRGGVWKLVVRVTAVTFVVLTLYAMFRSAPEVESVTDVASRASDLRVRTLGFLVPFWLSVVALTWILFSQIRLHDRITASGLSTPLGKA